MSTEGRRWFEQRKEFTIRLPREAPSVEPPDLLARCEGCSELYYIEVLAIHAKVCPACGHHHRLTAKERLEHLCDPDSLVYHDTTLTSVDALGFVDSKPYHRRIDDGRRSVGTSDAYLAATGRMNDMEVEVGSFEFRYLGGSMGSVVGELITRQIERGIEGRRPVVIVSASGGARMQEGVLSLMQMAKTCAALAKLKDEAKQPYISILTHPTTGGVAASFAMLGDIIIAEPGALVGFAGPRVIQQTIGQELPKGFQTAEYLLEHGLIDQIVPRHQIPQRVAVLLRQLTRQPPHRTLESST